MTKRIPLLLLLVMVVGLVFSVPQAWASERAGGALSQWRAQDAGRIEVKVRHTGFNGAATSVVLYDQDWKALAESQPTGGQVTFDRLMVGDYHVMAYADDLEDTVAKDVPVFARRTTTLDMKLNKPVNQNLGIVGQAYKSCGAVWGEGSQIKVGNPYDRPVVYYQCGRVIGKIVSSFSCSSCRSGTWRYTTNCQKVSPIIVTIPCPRSRP